MRNDPRDDFDALMIADRWRKGAPRKTDPKPLAPCDDDESDDALPRFEVSPNRRTTKKRVGGPAELTPAMHALIELLLRGVEPFAAAKSCRFRRRALRHLLMSRAFRDAYERERTTRRSERAPTLEQIERAARPRDPEHASAPSAPMPVGYMIRLRPNDPETAA
jgi:hypothetical protein